MLKSITDIRVEIQAAQHIEYSYKGAINSEYRLYGRMLDGSVVMSKFWKNQNVITLNEFINIAMDNTNVQDVVVTNTYDDWVVVAYSKN